MLFVDPVKVIAKYPRSAQAMLDEMISEHWNNGEVLYCLGGLKFLVNSDLLLEEEQEAIVKQELLNFLKNEEKNIWLFAMFLNTLHG